MSGLLVYFLVQTPEATGIRVVARGKQAEKEAHGGRKVVGEHHA